MNYIDYLGDTPRDCYKTMLVLLHQLTYPKDPFREFRGLNGSMVFTVSKNSYEAAKTIYWKMESPTGVRGLGLGSFHGNLRKSITTDMKYLLTEQHELHRLPRLHSSGLLSDENDSNK